MFTAEKAIITLPLGVLKQGSIRFDPPLPADKQAAINKIGMGLLNKVYLRFPEVFWDEESDWISHVSLAKGEWAEFLNIYKYTGRPILVAFNAGRFGRTTESWSDETIVTAVTEVLRTLYGTGIPAPEAWQITRWAGDPLAGGSYSYLAPGSRPRDRDTLAAPLSNLLFFAGEATSKEYPSTVHGAYLSGRRAAEEVNE
jgi:monoamine oxidase